MITAVDTSVLLDLFRSESPFHNESRQRLQAAYDAGAIVACDVVYAELVPAFPDRARLDRALLDLNVMTVSISTDIAYEAGLRWKQYRQAGGPRTRVIPDFLIGGHAVVAADIFLTRDRGFYRTYFPELRQS